jgi:hypothetical protein
MVEYREAEFCTLDETGNKKTGAFYIDIKLLLLVAQFFMNKCSELWHCNKPHLNKSYNSPKPATFTS